ncbi:MAG TPA: zf-HC2 domain-containing protein [bacterium]|mgnify:CR=1 FL=1|nr:zf-HC2 domain-containing protein [bacterium]HOL34566.1 zf-HC2 domain-containing protein [bacterium]HPP07609.1 zf-HC2 domain-containing protein [bacterium]
MNCREVQRILSDYLEGLVSDLQKKEIEQHLQMCQKCQIELDEMKKTVKLLRSIPSPQAPEKLVESVMEKISAEKPRKRKFAFLLTAIAFAEIIVFVALFKIQKPVQIVYQPETHVKITQKHQEEKKPEIVKNKPVSRVKEKKNAIVSGEKTPEQVRTEIVIQLAYLPQPQMTFAKRNSEKEIGANVLEQQKPAEVSLLDQGMKKETSVEKKSQEIVTSLAAKSAGIPAPAEKLSVESEIIKYITDAGGKILSASPASDIEVSYVFVAEIPASSYKNFLDNLAGKFQIKNYDLIKDAAVSETFITIRLQIFR